MEKHTIFKIVGIFACALLFVGIIFFTAFDNATSPIVNFETDRLFIDSFDIVDAFYKRSSWITDSSFPYDQNQEYPQIGLLYITLPRLISTSAETYFLSFLMFAVSTYAIFLYVLSKVIRKIQAQRWRVWFALLPSFVFFAFSRFDIFAALLIVVSLMALIEKKIRASMIILSLAVLTKWYALLLAPLFLAFAAHHIEKKQLYKAIAWFVGVIAIIMLATIVMSGDKALYPYAFHASRGIEGGGFLWLIASVFVTVTQSGSVTWIIHLLSYAFFAVQMLPLIVGTLSFDAVKRRVHSIDDVLQLSAFVVLLFVLFGKFYSPQWEIWWLPLVLLAARNKKEFALIIVADILNYIQFPVLFQFIGFQTLGYAIVVLLRSAAMFWILYILGCRIFVRKQAAEVSINTHNGDV